MPDGTQHSIPRYILYIHSRICEKIENKSAAETPVATRQIYSRIFIFVGRWA